MKALFIMFCLGILSACATPNLFGTSQQSSEKMAYYSAVQAEAPPAPVLTEIEKCESASQKGCDLVTYISLNEEPEIKKACLSSGKKKSECNQEYRQMLASRFVLKYDKADFNAADLWCRSEPLQCNLTTTKGQAAYEMKLRESNDRKYAEINDEKIERMRAEVARANDKNRRILGAAFSGFGAKSQCVSHSDGYGNTRTTCY